MKKKTAREEWDDAVARLRLVEREAGVVPEPKLWGGDDDEEDRRIAFSIADPDVRKRYIKAQRECLRAFYAREREELSELYARQRDRGERIRKNYLWGAIAFGVVAVLFGHSIGSTLGAVVGGVVAVLVGVNHIRKADRLAADEKIEVDELVEEQERSIAERKRQPAEVFSATEEETGLPEQRYSDGAPG